MESHRKEMETLLASLKPAGLSERTLNRLESAMAGELTSIDASLSALEERLSACQPRALKPEMLEALMQTVAEVPFAVNDKVLMFPGARKEVLEQSRKKSSPARRLLAIAAVAIFGGLAALMVPQPAQQPSNIASNNHGPAPVSRPGVVVASYGSGIENVEDRGVVWSEDRRANRVLRFQYQDRALVRDPNGVERMLLIPREEVFVVPVKVD